MVLLVKLHSVDWLGGNKKEGFVTLFKISKWHSDDTISSKLILSINKKSPVRISAQDFLLMGCTGIEPVTSSMSTKRSPAELTARLFKSFVKINHVCWSRHLLLYKIFDFLSIKTVVTFLYFRKLSKICHKCWGLCL